MWKLNKKLLFFFFPFLLFSCGGEQVAEVEEEEALPMLFVEAYQLSSGDLVDTIQASGILRGVREAGLISETQGRIIRDNMVLGQKVTTDTVLLEVDSTIAKIALDQNESQYSNARLDFETTRQLFNSGTASRAEFNRSQGALNGAKAGYERALKAYEDTRIRPPFSGYISQKESGASLGNNLSPGMLIGTVVDLSSLRMELSVGESEIAYIRPGQKARITIPSLAQEYNGEVTEVAAGADPRTGSFRFVVQWDNPAPNGVRSGLSAWAKVEVKGQSPSLIIPSFGIIKEGDQSFVYRVENGVARKVPLTITGSRANRATGISDLVEGDLVITSGLTSLGEGRSVEVSVLGNSGDLQ